MLQQNKSRAFFEKYWNDPRVPWRHKRREIMATAGIIPVAKWLAKIKQQSDVSCRLCLRAREQRGASTENLPEETYGHINSAFCDGMATAVTAAHHCILRHEYASTQAAQTPASKLRYVTSDKESSMNTLWQENRRPDSIVINKNRRTLYVLESKRSSDRDEDSLRVKEDEANEQHKSIIEALKAAALAWMFEQINFVAGRRGAVVEDEFYNKLEKLNVQAGKMDKILAARVQRICKAHDTVI